MPNAATMTDREKAKLPANRQLRSNLAPFLNLYMSTLNNALPLLPSYIEQPLRELIAALSRWKADEDA